MKSVRRAATPVILTLAALAAAPASARDDPATPEEEIHFRQSVMVVLGRIRGDLQAMAKGDVPFDAAAAQKAAALSVALSELTPRGFGPGTESGAPTKADAKIWKEMPKYKAANDKMVAAVAKLPVAAKDKSALKDALGDVGKACKGCHDAYKLVEYRN